MPMRLTKNLNPFKAEVNRYLYPHLGVVAKLESFSVLTLLLPYKIVSMIASKIFARVSSGSS